MHIMYGLSLFLVRIVENIIENKKGKFGEWST